MAEPWRVAEEGVGPEEGPDSAQLLCAYMAGSVAWLGRAALSCLIFRQLLFEGMIPSSGWMPGTALHFPSRPLSGVSAPMVSPSLHQPHPPQLARSGSASCLCCTPWQNASPASTPQMAGMYWGRYPSHHPLSAGSGVQRV